MGDVVQRRGHVVDRDDVGVAELGSGQRHPLGQHVAQLLDRLEEVVGPVDLVHLAGLRVADDDGGPVDAPVALEARPRDALRSEEHTSELQSRQYLVCRLLLEKKKKHNNIKSNYIYTNNSIIIC